MYFIQADNLLHRYYIHLYESDKIRFYVHDCTISLIDCIY